MRARSSLIAVLIVVLGAAAGAPPRAHAASARERAAAREFGYAAYRFRLAILAQRPEIRRRVRALDDGTCQRAIGDAPARAKPRILAVYLVGALDAMLAPVAPALGTFVADLERVRTRDRILRSGRAAWFSVLDQFRRLPVVDDPCAMLLAWRQAGWDEAHAPAIDPRVVRRLTDASPTGATVNRKLRSAGREMRRLGVKPSAARRFSGDTLFRGVLPEDSNSSSGSGSSGHA